MDIDESTYEDLDTTYDQVSGSLVKMTTNADEWCGPNKRAEEEPALYELGDDHPQTPTHPDAHTQR